MRTVFLILVSFSALYFISCKKESDTKHCWQIVDNVGNDLNVICNKTEAEMIDCVNSGACGYYFGGAPKKNKK